MKILIKVTKDILEKSKMCHESSGHVSENCAIALAVRDILPHARVRSYGIELSDGWEYNFILLNLPIPAMEFIREFDRTKWQLRPEMQPISFEIDVPDSVIEQIGIEEAKAIISKSETLELVL